MRAVAFALAVSYLALGTMSAAADTTVGVSEAQESATSSGSSTGLDEIVVTAMRRKERLQDVPASISAISGNALAEQHIQTPSDLAGEIPNLQATLGAGTSVPMFSLRGISMYDFSFNQQGPIATYFDEVYKGDFPLMTLDMFDMDRIEVLRGPQGTLYGKNTTGGAINFVSRKPDFNTDGYIEIGYGNYNRIDADGAFQVPLSEQLASRFAFTFSRADGWFENLLPGYPDGNGVHQWALREQLLYKPNDTVDFTLRLSTGDQDPSSYGVLALPGPTGVGAGVYEAYGTGSSYFRTGLGPRQIESQIPYQSHRTYGVALTSNWHVSDSLTITSISSYDYGRLYVPEDSDGSPLKVLGASSFGLSRQFSQDLRLASSYAGPFNFISGVYFNRETTHGQNLLTYFTDLFGPATGQAAVNNCEQTFFYACTYENSWDQTRMTAAVYTDASYKVNDLITLRGGLRYTHDWGEIDYNAQVWAADGTPITDTIPGDPTNLNAQASRSYNAGKPTGKVGIDFNLAADVLFYASYSRGYRGSAFNAQAYQSPAELTVAKPETVNAYEIGFKSQYLDRSVTLNGAIFYDSYDEQQTLTINPTNLLQPLINIPKSRIYGGELELNARPLSNLQLRSSLGVVNATIVEGVVSGVDISGNPLQAAPRYNALVGFDWTFVDGPQGKITLSPEANYTTRQYFDLFKDPAISQPGFALMNGHLTYALPAAGFSVDLWAKNIFDKYYYRQAINLLSGFGYNYYQLGDPRTFGISFRYNFR
jgi:iron complex outermembrane recepter protein